MGFPSNPFRRRSRRQELLKALDAFLQAATWEEARRLVEAHPELLGEEADALLVAMIARARAEGDGEAVRYLEEQRSLLLLCREVGVARAFQSLEEETLKAVPETCRTRMAQAQEALERYEATGEEVPLDAAVAAWEGLLNDPQFPSLPLPFRLEVRLKTGRVFLLRHQARRDPADLDRAVTVWEAALPQALEAPGSVLTTFLNNLAIVLHERYKVRGEETDLDRAVEYARRAVELTPLEDPYRASRNTLLGQVLWERYRRSRRLEDLEESIDAFRRALRSTRPEDPDLATRRAQLAAVLRERYRRRRDPQDLDEAIAELRQGVHQAGETDPDLPRFWKVLGHALWERYVAARRPEDLDEAIAALRRTIALGVREAFSFYLLGLGLMTRYNQRKEEEDLDGALTVLRQALELAHPEHSFWPSLFGLLGEALWARYRRTRSQEDLDEAVTAFRRAIEALPEHHPTRPSYLASLGLGLWERYVRRGRTALEDLNGMIAAFREALARTPPDDPWRIARLAYLGRGLWERSARTGSHQDLEEAIPLLREAVAGTPEEDPARLGRLYDLGAALRRRFFRLRQLEDLEEGIEALWEVVNRTPETDPLRPGRAYVLGMALWSRFLVLGQPEDLEEAIELLREAVAGTPEEHSDRPGRLADLGLALKSRFFQRGRLKDLEEALACFRAALEALPLDAPIRPLLHSHLGIALNELYDQTRDPEVLEEAVEHGRRALELASEGDSRRWIYQKNLGQILMRRHFVHGEDGDLEEAEQLFRQSLDAMGEGHPDYPLVLYHLGQIQLLWYRRTGDLVTLEGARLALQAAVEDLPTDSPARPTYLSDLGLVLWESFLRHPRLETLEAAIGCYREALTRTPEEAPLRGSLLVNLGLLIRLRYLHTRNADDLEAAIELLREGLDRTSEGSSRWSEGCSALGLCLWSRYLRTREPQELEEAIRFLRKGLIGQPERSPRRFFLLGRLGNLLRLRHRETEEGESLEEAIALLRQALQEFPAFQESREAHHYRIDLALALAARYDREGAPQDLEEARRLLREVGKLDVEEWPRVVVRASEGWGRWALERGAWEEAGEAFQMGLPGLRVLDRAVSEGRGEGTLPPQGGEILGGLAYARARQGDLREAVRLLERRGRRTVAPIDAGVEEGLPPWEEIETVSHRLPLVYLVATPAGGLALVVERAEVVPVWLDGLTEKAVEDWLRVLGRDPLPEGGQGDLAGLLPRIGEALIPLGEVLASLARRTSACALLPAGPLALLPWPAVPCTDRGEPILDLLAVSWTPAAALLSRTPGEGAVDTGSFLAVGTSGEVLSWAGLEARFVAALWSGPTRFWIDDGAPEADLKRELARAAVLHLAVPARSTPRLPRASSLALAGGSPFSLHRLLEDGGFPSPSLRLIVLSAHRTAFQIPEDLPDDPLLLPAAFLGLGVPGVLGTLWSGRDLSAVLLLLRFYQLWLGRDPEGTGSLPPTQALRAAQRWLRDLTYRGLEAYLSRTFADLASVVGEEALDRLSAGVRSALREEQEEARPYADPVHWAGFVFYGL